MGDVRKNRARRGTAIVETAFMVPWIFFLFVGVLDFGFYSYAAIATQNAARAAALAELQGLPNLSGITTCGSNPVTVTLAILDNTTTPKCADCDNAVTPSARSVRALVTYQTLPMVPIPGVLTGQLTLTRDAEARILLK